MRSQLWEGFSVTYRIDHSARQVLQVPFDTGAFGAQEADLHENPCRPVSAKKWRRFNLRHLLS